MNTTVPLSRLRTALVHLIAVAWFSAELTYRAGYGLGVWLHQLNATLAHAITSAGSAAPQPTAQPQQGSLPLAPSSGGIEPLCPGCWWDLIDPTEADQELPLRWAV